MASKRESLQRIHIDGATTGLDLSRDRGSINEQLLWEATNVCRNNRGTIVKRPEFVQYNTQLVEPTDVQLNAGEKVSTTIVDNTGFILSNPTGGCTDITINGAVIQVAGWKNLGSVLDGSYAIRYLQENEQLGSGNQTTVSFIIKCNNLDPVGFWNQVFFAANENNGIGLYISIKGFSYLDYATEDWIEFAGSSIINDGTPHRVDLKQNGNTLTLYIDGVLIDSVNAVAWPTYDYNIKVTANSDASLSTDNYTIELSGIIIRDSIDGIFTPRISNIYSLLEAFGNAMKTRIYTVGEKYLWCEYDHSGMWEPILRLRYSTSRLISFRNSLILINFEESGNLSEMYHIFTDGTISKISRAPNCKFGVEFANRLFVSGDNANPKRIYYSGDRDPNTWVVPDLYQDIPIEDMLNAGYFDIMSDKTARVIGMNNKFYGTLIVGTDDSLRVIKGTSPSDFSQSLLSGEVGMAGSNSGVSCINDFLCLNKAGVSSVVATDKFGDIASERKSYLLSAIFDPQNLNSRSINWGGLPKAILYYNQTLSMLFVGLTSFGSNFVDTVYTCNLPDGFWFGPFTEEMCCMSSIFVGTGYIEHTVIGTTDGRVKVMTFSKPDMSEAVIGTATLDGRSIDPILKTMTKTWKHIRIMINPTGNWPMTVRWKTNSGVWQEREVTLARKTDTFVGSTTVATAKVIDRSDRHIIEIPIDSRSTTLKVQLVTEAPRLSLVAMDIDFNVSGYEKEN